MEQACSRKGCRANIVIQEDQDQKAAMFDGKPICNKCDRFLHAPLPIITINTEPAKMPYEEPKAYKEEVIYNGRDHLDYPAHLPFPKEGYAVRRIQVSDEEGNTHYKYIRRYVGSTREPM